MCEYMAGSRKARRNRMGAQYFDEFRTHFWERSEDEFDRIRNINTSNRRRNMIPAPSIVEVERVLSIRPSVRRTDRSSSVISRRSQRQSPYPTLTHDEINVNTINPDVENPEQIIGRASSAETSSLQPPPYEATN